MLILISLVIGLSSCGAKKKEDLTNLITEFEYSCNTLDVDAILDCIDPRVSDNIKLLMGVYGMFSDKDIDEVIDELSESLIGDSSISGNDFFSSVKIDVQDIVVEDNEALVTTYVEYVIAGETFNRVAEFYCVYYMDKWYVSDFELV